MWLSYGKIFLTCELFNETHNLMLCFGLEGPDAIVLNKPPNFQLQQHGFIHEIEVVDYAWNVKIVVNLKRVFCRR